MPKFGYKLMTEEHGPKALVENAIRAENAGFDFVSISDHVHLSPVSAHGTDLRL
jgi:alkanesulfonate monooxygenase SsuD/methylene tetrahydromethanopterin reductase-like flavin-dependent oxidoreductase (luciferase family)